MNTTTDAMKRRAKAALEDRALPIPPMSAGADPEVLARLDRIEAAITEQREATQTAWAAIEAMRIRLDLAPSAVTRCETAAGRMEGALEDTVRGVSTIQEVGRRVRDAAAELMEHREGRLRRMAAALILTGALSNVLSTVWLAWRANLL